MSAGEEAVTMSSAQNWHKWLVLSLFGLALSARSIGCDYSSITEKFGADAVARCNEKCPFQNRTGDGHFDVNCGSDCSLQQCKLGCSLWHQALEQSCQTVCNVTSDTVLSRELYCVIGCNEALNTYFQNLRDVVGTPSAPALVADSLTATSLSLTWEPRNLINMSYLVQWKYEELPSTWQYYSNTSHSDGSIIHVENLQPYTKYRFRVAIFLSGRSNGEPIYSEPSVVISTSESGKPTSAPLALRAAAPDSSRVAISWEPGAFANGPLISYVLRLTDTQPNTIDALEDMPASNNTLFYMFQNLAAAREYEVSVTMRNAVGEGPRAVVRVSTPPLPKSTLSQQPVLILGGEHNILAAPANDMLSDPIELYSTEHVITGVGIDIQSDSLFVSVSNGFVHRSSLTKKSVSETIVDTKIRNTQEPYNYKPLDLSVDWLNRHIYVLGEVYYTNLSNMTVFPNWEIIRYDFDGKNQIVAMSGFNLRPIHFEVDPYNGYLFYAIRSIERGGLYRLDLANISNGVRHDGQPEMIVRDPHLGAFTVDHKDFRILVAHVRRNTVLAVSLDGREVTDFRSNTQTPMFKSTRSIAYANGLFYWTNGNEMLTEEYHAQSDSYFHNEYPLAYNTKVIETRQVLVALRSCQPIPVPVNPPLLVQSVMGISKAKVSWSPPHLLGHQGSGAWQQWTFHLQLTHVETGDVIDVKDIKDFFYIVENLKSDAEYVIKVAAVTVSGSGPWSTEFIGKTLAQSPSNIHSTLLWSGPNGLLQTDLTGDNLETLIHKSLLQNFTITDISWYRDKLYLVTNESTVHWYNITSHTRGVMPNMDNVGCLAVDWVGKKIYWSNPKQQLITRGNFDGTNREPVPIVTVAKELAIDSMEAYIYWNTGHAVEAARLNGENKMVYYPAQLFSGKQVMGITLDLENKMLYWLVRSYDGSELHRAPSADVVTSGGGEMGETLVSRLGGALSLGPLVYFSGRLAWLQDAARAVLADLAGRYPAQLMPRVRGLAHRDPTRHAHSESLVAIPDMINASSIAIEGTWDSFNVTWAPVTNVNVNNSRVYYDVSLHFNSQNKIEKTVSVPWVVVSGGAVRAYSAVSGAVRAVTAWGAGPPAPLAARSPPAPPARPAAPRAYTACRHRCDVVSATFRWSAPLRTNGVLAGYEPQCSLLARGAPRVCAARPTPPTRTELVIPQLDHNATYYFRVRAFTDGGYGPFSDVISISSDEINPIPRVMLSSQEAIKIIDLDNGDSETIPKTTGLPVDFAISIEENVVFWANPLEEIFSSRINVSGHYKLISNNGSAKSVCVDWVARALYFSQAEGGAHALLRAALGPPPARAALARLSTRRRAMLSMQIAPLHGTLFWFEEGEYPGLGKIMKSNLNGTEIKTFFNNTEQFDADECNCSENPDTTKSFVVDMTKDDDYELYWIDPWMHRIVASDMYGCRCRTVLNATESKKYGFPPMSITVDSKHVFWFNSTEKQIYYTDKYNQSAVERVKTTHGYKIMALDPAGQKYPPQHCLYPEVQTLVPKVISNSTNSLTLQMPPVDKPYECRNLTYEMTLPEYTIYYRVDTPNDTSLCDKVTCQFITSTNTEVTLTDLKPFTNYTVMLEATNYYAKLHEMRPIAGALSVLQTAAEAPSAPKNVRTTALTPELALVEWTPVPGVKYEVHWRTDDLHTTASPKLKEHNTMEAGGSGAARLPRLSAGTPYLVWVAARGPHSARAADSAPARLNTPPRPPPPAAPAPAPTRLALAWPAPRPLHEYGVEYTEATVPLGEWKSCEEVKRDEWEARDLKPKTKYRFRLRLQYVDHAPIYYWPPDDRFTYETLGCAPGRPGRVRAEDVGSHMVRAWWAEPEARGAPVTHYRLWGRPLHRVVDNNENTTKNIDDLLPPNLPDDLDDETKQLIVREGLELLHNGTEPYWLVSAEQLAGAGGYWAGVQARNAYGWGDVSPRAALARAAPPPRPPPLLALAAALALLLALALAVILAYNSRNKKKKKAVDNRVPSNVPRRGPDVELATLRQLPPVRHSTNILYNQGVHCPSDAEISNLPHIRREQITLTKFLGSGAFGEVFEGIARQINGATTDTKVAVKTLRKGATEQEKSEFLKEAALMSNFKHDNILRLLGVCLDNDPNYIIMELMEGGDLLSYLRAKRASLYSGGALSLLDLLSMCVDVTTGCRYLEELHFVHRDLAARNCLVATRRRGRVVKIGDFGLARDIYKNDYYRKEGEGLLPVRWMAVECLVDGVFSCQSDVWAWAVLCWEILSLGQQPYPGRTNRQVLSYVRSGGKPDRPPNCPSVFYDLLQKCWSYNAEARPSFRHCLEVVTELRDKTSPNITLTATAATPHYLTLLGDGVSPTNDTSYRAWAACDAVDNRSYLLDENGNARLDEDGPASEMEPSRTLSARSSGYAARARDGYEVPRRSASLRARRPNATIVPLRAGPQRASLCEPRAVPAPPLLHLDLDLSHHVFNTPF